MKNIENTTLIENIRALIAGIFIGWANAIPGVSGGTLAVITGVFDRLVEVVNDIVNFKLKKKDTMFLLPIILGLLIGLITGSKILVWGFRNYPLYTYSFFFGLVLFSLFNIKEDITYLRPLEFLVGVFIVIFPYLIAQNLSMGARTILNNSSAVYVNYVFLFFAGIIAGSSMVLPGLSGSLMLMILGFYEQAISIVVKMTNVKDIAISDIGFLTVLGVGVLFGIGIIAKILKIWFEKAKVSIMNFILGLVAGSLYPITPAFHGQGNTIGMLIWIFIGSTVVYFLVKIK
ncbi:MAG: DUF368 domain-containing protein [Fervidobacterium sp.]